MNSKALGALRAKKRFGQHFLSDAGAVSQIVSAAKVGADDFVVEIGPGRGALTGLLLEQARKVVGIEVDRELCAYLNEYFGTALGVLNRDVLEVDLAQLVREEGAQQAVLVGNLPYNITGAIIQQILRARSVFRCAVVMVQREVARRIMASPGGKEYGLLSISVQLHTQPEKLFDLSPGQFNPVPQVHSSVLRFNFEKSPVASVSDEQLFFKVIRAAFQQRRKMLKNTLAFLAGGPAGVARVCAAAGVDSRLRPEAVSIAQFEQICRALSTLPPASEASQLQQEGGAIGTA